MESDLWHSALCYGSSLCPARNNRKNCVWSQWQQKQMCTGQDELPCATVRPRDAQHEKNIHYSKTARLTTRKKYTQKTKQRTTKKHRNSKKLKIKLPHSKKIIVKKFGGQINRRYLRTRPPTASSNYYLSPLVYDSEHKQISTQTQSKREVSLGFLSYCCV